MPIQTLARAAGFDLAGVAPAAPLPDAEWFLEWARSGKAARMGYLTDRRAELRRDPRQLLPSARSIICVAKVYNGPEPYTSTDPDQGWISRYAWGSDYHGVMRAGLERMRTGLREEFGDFESKICVDTAPLLERSYARLAGLGWIGNNACLINEDKGSWLFLGEMLVSLDLSPNEPAADRCGACTRCIDACPTTAIVPRPAREGPRFAVDAARCISYFTIELRGSIPEDMREQMGAHVFGCDICQDVCPWNAKSPASGDAAFAARDYAPELAELAALGPDDFKRRFAGSPVSRAGYRGMLRNAAVAMGNSGDPAHRPALRRLAEAEDEMVRQHAEWALERIR